MHWLTQLWTIDEDPAAVLGVVELYDPQQPGEITVVRVTRKSAA